MIYESPSNIQTSFTDWWFIYDSTNSQIISGPHQCCGSTSSPYTMVVFNSEEECKQYIETYSLSYNTNLS